MSTSAFPILEKKNLLEELHAEQFYYQLDPAALVKEALLNEEGQLTSTGALMCDTGKFTGRSPKDRFIVRDDHTKDTVWWGNVNKPFEPAQFEALHERMKEHLKKSPKVYVRDAYACAKSAYRLNIRVFNTQAWHNLFCYNMFMRPAAQELPGFIPDFTIIHIPEFLADPQRDGTLQGNFVILNFTKKILLIGGTGYAGEIKKGIFSALNYLLPSKYPVLPMHCSANIGIKGDTAVFFGLSGTGKTTLSADPGRRLIGDDEHGWDENSVFNFEGGCYAKVIHLSREKEPQIYDAIRDGSIVENTRFKPGTLEVNYEDTSVTSNTRTSYPLSHMDNAVIPSIGPVPKHIFFLTYDAFGVLPPVSKLTKEQAMYHFISGYTAKVAGTETGVTDPEMVFSACFGAPFLPLHPTVYAKMLGRKMKEHRVKVWLINTGWVGGPYGTGVRIKLPYTRAMITAVLEGDLDRVRYHQHPVFKVMVPEACPYVPPSLLNPIETWKDAEQYNAACHKLAEAFVKNFDKYSDFAEEEIRCGAPALS